MNLFKNNTLNFFDQLSNGLDKAQSDFFGNTDDMGRAFSKAVTYGMVGLTALTALNPLMVANADTSPLNSPTQISMQSESAYALEGVTPLTAGDFTHTSIDGNTDVAVFTANGNNDPIYEQVANALKDRLSESNLSLDRTFVITDSSVRVGDDLVTSGAGPFAMLKNTGERDISVINLNGLADSARIFAGDGASEQAVTQMASLIGFHELSHAVSDNDVGLSSHVDTPFSQSATHNHVQELSQSDSDLSRYELSQLGYNAFTRGKVIKESVADLSAFIAVKSTIDAQKDTLGQAGYDNAMAEFKQTYQSFRDFRQVTVNVNHDVNHATGDVLDMSKSTIMSTDMSSLSTLQSEKLAVDLYLQNAELFTMLQGGKINAKASQMGALQGFIGDNVQHYRQGTDMDSRDASTYANEALAPHVSELVSNLRSYSDVLGADTVTPLASQGVEKGSLLSLVNAVRQDAAIDVEAAITPFDEPLTPNMTPSS